MIGSPISILLRVGMFFPTFGITFAVIWSLLFNFRSSVGTACRAVNFLPTISSAIGLEPQKYVWRLSIALHIGLRFVLAAGYYHWHFRDDLHSQSRWYRRLVKLAITCHVIENLALLTLTTISSSDNGDIHEYSFVSFMIFSQIYMIMSCCLIYWTHRECWIKVTAKDSQLLRRKVTLWLFNLFIFLLSVYLYFRHNWYCEPYVYSYFAICEYLTIFSNIGFHYQAIHDFGHYNLALLASEDIVSRSKNS